MASRMDQFRVFVNNHPKIREDVASGKHSWQKVYEDWVILGEDDPMWKPYQEKASTSFNPTDLLSADNLKGIIGYLKKLNPDSISKTLNTVQKVLQISQSVGLRSKSNTYNANYNSWWD